MRTSARLMIAALSSSLGCHAGNAERGGSADSCAQWSAEVCRQLEPDSELCAALKGAVELMPPEACAVAATHPDHVKQKLAARAQQCGALETKLCHDIGDKTRACKLVRTQTPGFTPERCITMLGKYAEVLEALQRQSTARQLPAEQAAKLGQGEPPAFGPIDAPLQLVQFVDFENPDCVHGAEIMRELKANYGDKLHFVVRQFPLRYNPHARLAAEAALAANAQGKFWEMHDKLLANQKQLDRASLTRYAAELQLDVKQLRAALDHQTFEAAVAADVALGEELNVQGMPTLFVNGERMLNAVDRDSVLEAAEEHLLPAAN